MHRGFWNMPFNMWGIWIIPIVLLLIIAIAVFMIVNNKKDNRKIRGNPALDILNERFARGEIDEEEYINKKKNLSS